MQTTELETGKKDGRKYDHETLEAIRLAALDKVVKGESPESVVRALGLSRSCIYKWLAKFKIGGAAALKAKKIPGRPPKMEGNQLSCLKTILVENSPVAFEFEEGLWTREIIRDLVDKQYGLTLSLASISRILAHLGIIFHRPLYKFNETELLQLKPWLSTEYPRIKKEAKLSRAEIFMVWDDIFMNDGNHEPMRQISAVSPRGLEHFVLSTESDLEASHRKFLDGLGQGRKLPVSLLVHDNPLYQGPQLRQHIRHLHPDFRIHYLPHIDSGPSADAEAVSVTEERPYHDYQEQPS